MVDNTLRPFNCEICNLTFTSKQFLKRHYVVHTDDRNFECSICSRSYKYKKGLNRHYKKYHPSYYNTTIRPLNKDQPPISQEMPAKQLERTCDSTVSTKKIPKNDFLSIKEEEKTDELANLLMENELKIFTTTPFPSQFE